jgi:hypothetical protein
MYVAPHNIVQSLFASRKDKLPHDPNVAEVSKLAQMCVDVVQNTYKPAEEAVRKVS